jgi:hypothetical protein
MNEIEKKKEPSHLLQRLFFYLPGRLAAQGSNHNSFDSMQAVLGLIEYDRMF